MTGLARSDSTLSLNLPGLCLLAFDWLTPSVRISPGHASNQELVLQGPDLFAMVRHMQLLATLLTEHGVPTQQAHERARQAISKLRLSAVQLARAAPPPWTELKARASTPATMFRLVLFCPNTCPEPVWGSHLHRQEKLKGKGERRPRITPTQPDPADLSLFAESLVDAKQLAAPLFHVMPLQSMPVALPFAPRSKPCPSSRLPSASAQRPSTNPARVELEPLIFPAHYQGTGEPVLLPGSILQAGRHCCLS